MKVEQVKTKRKRGVILTSAGLKRLQKAMLAVESRENEGKPFTLEEIGNRINVSTKTLSRLWSLNIGIDQKTLRLCFNGFNLELQREDYLILSEQNEIDASQTISLLDTEEVNSSGAFQGQYYQYEHRWTYPDGPVPLDSPFYVERPPSEELVYREVTQPGCVIRIRAHREMGKSSLVLRLLNFAQKQGYRTVNLNCYQIDSDCLVDLNKLLRCLCWRVARELNIEPNLDEMWDEEIGCKLSCSFYLHNYLLKQIESPVVLVLNEVDRFFEYPHIAQEFFPLLRSWYEEARQDTNWQKLRLVVIYSTEEYVKLDTNRSPFNVGLPIRLQEFTQQQVEELASRYGLDWSNGNESEQIMWLVGGHPALIRIALYYLCCQGIDFAELITESMSNGGIYRHHLWQHWLKLQENPGLARVYAELVAAGQSVYLNPVDTYKLDGLGLIRYEGDRILPRCQLYQAYFAKQLSTII